MTIDEIRDNFELLEEWDDRYRYVIELGRMLDPMPEAEHSAANKVNGCASQVWLSRQIDRSGNGEPRLKYLGDSDAHIVRGLIAILLTLYSGRTPQQILTTDALAVFDEFGFREHLTPQRSNGLRSMVERIRADAREALATASQTPSMTGLLLLPRLLAEAHLLGELRARHGVVRCDHRVVGR
jgi:cysteine desulfuration protein SufE